MLNNLLKDFYSASVISEIDNYVYHLSSVNKPNIISYDRDFELYYLIKLELVAHEIYTSVFDLELIAVNKNFDYDSALSVIYDENERRLYIYDGDKYETWKFPRWPRNYYYFCWINPRKNAWL